MRSAGFAAAAMLLALSGPAMGERLDPAAALAKSQGAIGRTIGNYRLTDSHGAALELNSTRGRPLVISLVYTACSSVCPPTTQRVIKAVEEANRTFGTDRFAVLTLGFDARNDTPASLSSFAATQGINFPNWQVASADPATLEALLRDLGFSYRVIAGGFDHVSQTTIVDREGRIYRQIYGDEFPITMFMEPLKEAIFGGGTPLSLAGIIDRVRFICTTYDPGSGRYRIDYGLTFGAALAALSLVVMGSLIAREWIRT
jgi:protein SCO1/2